MGGGIFIAFCIRNQSFTLGFLSHLSLFVRFASFLLYQKCLGATGSGVAETVKIQSGHFK